ncbi:hypothetical protein NCER_100287 [Vairimorpha ceranae BRL01]|uniref:Synaptobrevin-related protein n=2 Tax=Vairimorpha ceranae TaxID=40302 RepID=C4V782_VAIC1|nr:synaptobrevin-related protein [Vairimorpha ceranae]EEQ82921.1 hypothetical protein NCER_100287 [Vairimorpha ceranae BRL01]KAF5140903.1 hypothetical protein G9O61_00g008930 [Vairimorpha ceranae]KKO75799.1 synaptobrevin-related protein [Vairimorpha ceranae]
MSDKVTEQIEDEVNKLKSKVAERLKETEEIADLEGGLEKRSSGLVRTTEEHQQVSSDTRRRLFYKWAKYTIILALIIGLLVWIVFKPILKPIFEFIYAKIFGK